MIQTTPLEYALNMMSIREVATELGISPTTVSKHSKEYKPTPATHMMFVNLVAALMSPPETTDPEERIAYEALQALMNIWRGQRYKRRVLGRAEKYKKKDKP
jgi:predicted transcriptional regulator